MKLNHPNIFHFYEKNNKLCIVCKYIKGKNLCQVLKDRSTFFFEGPLAWKFTAQIASAVLHIHQLGIVHRDSKLENIFLYENWMLSLEILVFLVELDLKDKILKHSWVHSNICHPKF
jgi:serine/threonine protein kinase